MMYVYVLTCKHTDDHEQTPEGVFYSFESMLDYLKTKFNFESEAIHLVSEGINYGYFKNYLNYSKDMSNLRIGWYVCKIIEENK